MNSIREEKGYRTVRNYDDYNSKNGIVNGQAFDLESEPSLTVPDMAFTMREILERFTRGQEVQVLKPQYPDEEVDVLGVDIDQLDKMERLELLEHTRSLTTAFQKALQDGREAIKNKPVVDSIKADVVDDLDG